MKNKYCKRCEENVPLKGRKYCLQCINFLTREKKKKKKELDKFRKEQRKLKDKEKKENSITKLIKQADILFAKAIKQRDRKCVLTGLKKNLQCAHIFSRANKAVRWDMDNAITLTAGRHLYWAHTEPVEFTEFVKDYLGEEKYQRLRQKANAMFKLTPEFIKQQIEFLKSYLEE